MNKIGLDLTQIVHLLIGNRVIIEDRENDTVELELTGIEDDATFDSTMFDLERTWVEMRAMSGEDDV